MCKRLLTALTLFILSGGFALASPAAACETTISDNAVISGSWFSTCRSTVRRGAYAQLYTFTLAQASFVQIDLESSIDSRLYLLSPRGGLGRVITSDDNSGGNLNARIRQSLTAGTYMIEATTTIPGLTGSFRLSVRTNGGPSSCRTGLSLGSTARGNWAPACVSVHRTGSNARYYTFTLTKQTNVQIDLTSSVDSYLYLLTGASAGGNVLSSNDNSGGRGNARISRTLPSGTYTVEATTNLPGVPGAFTLKVAKIGKAGEED